MKFSEEQTVSHYPLRAYGQGWVQVNNEILKDGFILSRHKLTKNLSSRSLSELSTEDLDSVLSTEPEVIIFGSNESHLTLSMEILKTLIRARIGFEQMRVDAACRTYQVLLAEDRKVTTIIFPRP